MDSDDDYYDDSDDYDYDDYQGGVDAMTFQISGYGGFGYDTSDVTPNDPHSAVFLAAQEGNLDRVRCHIEGGARNDTKERLELLNGARRWTEVDYRMSGFTKEYEWFDLTPVAQAALSGHSSVVMYLLRQGADPTLKGCPTENEYYDALAAAKKAHSKNVSSIMTFFHFSKKSTVFEAAACARHLGEVESPRASAIKLVRELAEDPPVCVKLIEAVQPFWLQAPYSSAQYTPSARSEYTNKPIDMQALLSALDQASPELRADENRHELSPEQLTRVTFLEKKIGMVLDAVGSTKQREDVPSGTAHTKEAQPTTSTVTKKKKGETVFCTACETQKDPTEFSSRQRSQPAQKRRCALCIRKKGETIFCTACKTRKDPADFSSRQRSQSAQKRRCVLCIQLGRETS